MEISELFLVSFYRRVQSDNRMAYLPQAIGKVLYLLEPEIETILKELDFNGLIGPDPAIIGKYVMTDRGVIVAKSLLRKKNVIILQFLQAASLLPTDKAVYGFLFSYQLLKSSIAEKDHSITVTISDVAAMSKNLSFEKNESGEKLLLRYARDYIVQKLMEGNLRQHETLEIMLSDLNLLPAYDHSRLPGISEAEFVLDLGEKPDAGRGQTTPERDGSTDEGTRQDEPVKTRRTRSVVPYLQLPVLPLLELEVRWLNIIYLEFLDKVSVEDITRMPELWQDFPGDFNPKAINSLLLFDGNQISLYGIYHLDQKSSLFELFDDVVYAIKEILQTGGKHESITSQQLYEKIPGLKAKQVYQVFTLMRRFPDLGTGIGISADNEYSITLTSQQVFDTYRMYSGLQRFMEKYLASHGTSLLPVSDIDVAADGNNADSEEITLGRTRLVMKSRMDFKPVMGVEALAFDLAKIIEVLPVDKGQMIGIFGRWGRGKTFFINVLKGFLGKSEVVKYISVEFHAWKYQETPASWAYLYESLAKEYLGPEKGVWPFLRYWRRLILLNIKRFGIWSIVPIISGLVITLALPFAVYYFFDGEQMTLFWSSIPLSILLSSGVIKKVHDEYSTKGIDLIKKYTTRNTFKASMGIQADIQEELVKLLKVWIPEKELGKWKIVLVVEDADRCSEEKIIQNIDALRVMLEDDEISKRLLIITAIDERILRNAIKVKYASLIRSQNTAPNGKVRHAAEKANDNNIHELITEYLDKLFICAIKLGALTHSQKVEYLEQLFLNDREENGLRQDKGESGAVSEPKESVQTHSEVRVTLVTNAPPDPVNPVSLIGPIDGFSLAMRYWEKLSEAETVLFSAIIQAWPEATPRKISIFYYRYLLCKNILLDKYANLSRPNVWSDRASIKAVMNLLLHFGNCHHPEYILSEMDKLKDLKEGKPMLPGLDQCKIKEELDYRLLLEVMELIIAY